MAISDRITSIEEHIKESYQELEGIGIDTTGVNNNLENIPKLLDGYWETLPKVTGEGTSITLDNTKEAKMKINLKGNTSQEGTPTPETPQDIHVVSGDNSIEVKGYNLYNANDTNAVANGYIIQSDGTLKLNEIDNTSGSSPIFKNFVLPITQFKTNTTYTFVLEILSVSGSGHITMNESNATTQFSAISSLTSKTFDSLHAGDIIIGTATTKADFTNCTRALSSYCYFLAGEKGSITFRLSIINGTSVTPQTFIYQPYQSASYPINLGDIELCKIGDYQDYIYKDNKKWYKYGAIGKVVLNGSENWTYINSSFRHNVANLNTTGNDVIKQVSNYYKAITYSSNWSNYDYFVCYTLDGNVVLKNKDITNINDFKTWLGTHNTIVYYVLATPTYTEITDSTLISQLNALAKSYASQTNISQESNDLASILNATALEEME